MLGKYITIHAYEDYIKKLESYHKCKGVGNMYTVETLIFNSIHMSMLELYISSFKHTIDPTGRSNSTSISKPVGR